MSSASCPKRDGKLRIRDAGNSAGEGTVAAGPTALPARAEADPPAVAGRTKRK